MVTTKWISYEEFFDSVDEDTLAEWVDGEVIYMTPPGTEHQRIFLFLASLMNFYAQEFDLGEALTAPFQMRLRALRRGREPDILFIAREHLDRLNDKYLDGPCDLAVEIVSPESVRRDRIEKPGEYEAAGIGEYWIIDPDRQIADFYVLNAEGRYEKRLPDEQGIYRSQVLTGFAFPVAWLRQSPLPRLREARLWLGLS